MQDEKLIREGLGAFEDVMGNTELREEDLPTEKELNDLKRAANELALFMDDVNNNEITKEIFQSVLSDQEKTDAKVEVDGVIGDGPNLDTANVKVLKKQLYMFEQQMKEMHRMIKKRMADNGVPQVLKKEMKKKFNREREQINRGIIMLRRMIYRIDNAEKVLKKLETNAG